MGDKPKKPIMGLDFGNFNSFVSFVSEFDPENRMKGTVQDLVPPELSTGIPSVYFYSPKDNRALLGKEAISSYAKPENNRIRYLKTRLGQTIEQDGKTIDCDKAIIDLISYIVQQANRILYQRTLMNTNLVSIAYPTSFTTGQRMKLIQLIEQAELEDGTKLQVYGSIPESAAAALDYLAEFIKTDQTTTVITYDLGGGTFDASLVTVYPKGRKSNDGNIYYYDVLDSDGLNDVGGKKFNDALYELIVGKVNQELSQDSKERIQSEVEKLKLDLNFSTEEKVVVLTDGSFLEIPITVDEFEMATRGLVNKTIDVTRKILENNQKRKPAYLILTGGASQMPMIKKRLEEEFPQFDIIPYRPDRAISYGTARFGTSEADSSFSKNSKENNLNKPSIVKRRVSKDIGLRYYKGRLDNTGYIETCIKRGSEIPFEGDKFTAKKVGSSKTSTIKVYEALTDHPDPQKPDEDYKVILEVTVDYGKELPANTRNIEKLSINNLNQLEIEVETPILGKNPVKNSVTYTNFS